MGVINLMCFQPFNQSPSPSSPPARGGERVVSGWTLARQSTGGRLLHNEQFASFIGRVPFAKTPYLHADPRRAEMRKYRLLRFSLFRSLTPVACPELPQALLGLDTTAIKIMLECDL